MFSSENLGWSRRRSSSIKSSEEFKDNLDIELTDEEIDLISGKIIDIRQSLVQ